jgi:CheY-like chemotaxis protein
MNDTRTRILIVDDEPSIRTSMTLVLTEMGYKVRLAQDGFSALSEMRNHIPDVLLSDLNMPGMSGFELLSVVRRRFPAIQTIAMSGAFQGNEVPSGVAADAFYQKGSSLASLLKILGTLSNAERTLPNELSTAGAPIWIQPIGLENSAESYVTIVCPECLRTFPQALGGSSRQIRDADCVYCRCFIRYAIVQPTERVALKFFPRAQAEEMPQSASCSQRSY